MNWGLVLEYDGTEFAGFQVQANARTVQGELEAALYKVTEQAIRVAGAGRTDAGVHAYGQVVSFRAELRLPSATLQRALNYYLPEDVAVRRAAEVPDWFDARRSARSRSYRYRLIDGLVPSPLRRRYVGHVPYSLDVAAMDTAVKVLIGEHDLAAFAGASGESGSTHRRVVRAAAQRADDEVHVDVTANAFLLHQVRATVGTLIWVGTGKIDVSRFREILDSRDRRLAGPTAPSRGLCLMRVEYPEEVII